MTKPNPSRVAHRHEAFRRVARRHTAGLFDAPPRVLKAVEDWAQGVYAGHVLALIENLLDTPPDDTEKRLAQTQKYLGGKLTEIEDDYKNVTQMHNTIKDIYKKHTNIRETELEEMLKHDLWWTADKCLQEGLVDELWTGSE